MTGANRRPATRASSTASKPTALRPPAWLTRGDAKAVWKRIVPDLQRFNVINESFRDALGRYCVHFADWIKLSREINKQGTTMLVKMTNSEERMPRLNPSIRVRDIIEKSLVDLEDRFGLSPLARFRIIAHQAAHPQRGLFDNLPPPKSDKGADKPGVMPPPKPTPVGILNTPSTVQ